jgi:dephospho-CoA kinase
MLVVGLTGGLACGKSFVGKKLAELGCHLIQADELGHEVLLSTGEAFQPVVNEFGPGVLNENGEIDRRKLAAMVFNNPERLAKLSAIVHPAVGRLQNRTMAEIAKTDPEGIVVVEAAIMVETGSYNKFDRLIVVVCTQEQQMERAMHRGQYAREEVEARIARQLPIEEKKRLAHFIIDTSGSKENTEEQTRQVYQALRSIKK